MIISVHQPNFIPWLGFFDKIVKSDVFVLLDEVNHNKRGFTHRNKIKTMHGEKYLTIPLLNKGEKINTVQINNYLNWQEQQLSLIKQNYKDSKYYDDHIEFITYIYSKEFSNMADFNIEWIRYILKYLRINTRIYLESNLKGNLGQKNERIINICKYFECDVYLSGNGARDYNDVNLYELNEIELIYQEFNHPTYTQLWSDEFVSHMSIIDALFNIGRDTIKLIGD